MRHIELHNLSELREKQRMKRIPVHLNYSCIDKVLHCSCALGPAVDVCPWNLCELNAKIVSCFFSSPGSLPLSVVVACATALVHRHCTKRTIPARLKIKKARTSHCLLPAGVNESLSLALYFCMANEQCDACKIQHVLLRHPWRGKNDRK